MRNRIAAALLLTGLAGAADAEDKAIVVGSYGMTIEAAPAAEPSFGWIQLRTADGRDAGYIYFTGTTPRPAHLSADKSYIVMDARWDQWQSILSILNGPKPVQIRYSSAASPNLPPVAAIETVVAGAVGGPALSVSAEEQKAITQRRPSFVPPATLPTR